MRPLLCQLNLHKWSEWYPMTRNAIAAPPEEKRYCRRCGWHQVRPVPKPSTFLGSFSEQQFREAAEMRSRASRRGIAATDPDAPAATHPAYTPRSGGISWDTEANMREFATKDGASR